MNHSPPSYSDDWSKMRGFFKRRVFFFWAIAIRLSRKLPGIFFGPAQKRNISSRYMGSFVVRAASIMSPFFYVGKKEEKKLTFRKPKRTSQRREEKGLSLHSKTLLFFEEEDLLVATLPWKSRDAQNSHRPTTRRKKRKKEGPSRTFFATHLWEKDCCV